MQKDMRDENNPGAEGTAVISGTLYLVGTPIGNLEDLTLRALRLLKEVSVVACEDTRQTQKLLNHYDIRTPALSYHEHNEAERAAELILRLRAGSSVALVSDAGTPCISDPGYRLVTLAIRDGIPVAPIPGACAFLCALIASGLAVDSFHFGGFLPAKSGQRRTLLESLRHSPRTEVFYETPQRITAALEDIVAILGSDRPLVIAREITKLHEEFLRGPAGDLLAGARQRPLRGEITLIISRPESGQPVVEVANLRHRIEQIMAQQGVDEKAALKTVARERGISRSEAYRELQRLKGGS